MGCKRQLFGGGGLQGQSLCHGQSLTQPVPALLDPLQGTAEHLSQPCGTSAIMLKEGQSAAKHLTGNDGEKKE